jgi:hypothetical protein
MCRAGSLVCANVHCTSSSVRTVLYTVQSTSGPSQRSRTVSRPTRKLEVEAEVLSEEFIEQLRPVLRVTSFNFCFLTYRDYTICLRRTNLIC